MDKAFAEDYLDAFILAGRAREKYLEANKLLRNCEHDKWERFYRNECLSDIKFTAEITAHFMAYIRVLGDGPHFYEWQRLALYPEEERRVVLITNMENHLTDEELFNALKGSEV